MNELAKYKQGLFEKCRKIIAEQVESARMELKKLQEMEGEETKSSAGDKYETGRAMLFLEKEKISVRLSESLKQQKALDQIKPDKVNETVGLGSLVLTDKGFFFIAVGLGKIPLDGEDFIIISPVSPLGKVMAGKAPGEVATFNKASYKIVQIA